MTGDICVGWHAIPRAAGFPALQRFAPKAQTFRNVGAKCAREGLRGAVRELLAGAGSTCSGAARAEWDDAGRGCCWTG